ncbi:MAG: AbiV family abortive infection protein [Elusimicrobiales bacterium]|nr:AbiV family abortive infection protein [Elusimicrobiales bacterium]
MNFEEIKALHAKCLTHASDLLGNSKLLLENGSHNVAYHLAALSLEEIGKSVMVLIGYTPELKNTETILRQAAEDHSKKLFWALWGSPGESKIHSKEEILSYIELSKRIHLKRLDGLYVNPLDSEHSPEHAVTPEETTELINLTEARLKLAEMTTVTEPTPKVRDNLKWFSDATQDPRKKPLIFGAKSIEKLNEFKDHNKWINWLHEEFDEADKTAQELIQKELNKTSFDKDIKDKWQLRYKLRTSSHSISQKVLNEWNSKFKTIQLTRGDSKTKATDLFVTLIFPSNVPINALHYLAWGQARLYAVSLSIASRGYFWWYLPKDISRFYEKIIDLENKMEVSSTPSKELYLDWGNNPLTKADLNNAVVCLRFLPKDNTHFLNAYVQGISLFGKNDIHTRFEPEIFITFFNALVSAMKFYNDYNDGESLETAFQKFFTAAYKDYQLATKEYIALGENYKLTNKFDRPITLSDCGCIKILADLYILRKMQHLADEDLQAKRHD